MTLESTKKKWVKTIQFLAAYLVAAWTFLQFVDWILVRYSISPYWVDLLLWIFVGIIPSLAIYFYNKERINRRELKKQERILFPLNILLIMAVTYFGFGNTDLGATTKDIKYTDEEGNLQSKLITKEEFRIGVPIFNFKNTKNNDSLDWWEDGIGDLLVYDLEQNKSISPYSEYISKTSDKIRQASLFHSFYIDGEFEQNGDSIKITVFKRKSNNAKILKQKTFEGTDFLNLIDEMSYYITEQAGFIETSTVNYLDLPVKEFMSSSLPAIQKFIDWELDSAIRLDSTFALAYLEKAKQNYRWNSGQLGVQDLTDKAFKYRDKLPLQKQLEVNIQRNLAYEDFKSAEAQVKLQLEVDPTNEFYNDVLFGIYGETKNIDAYYQQSEELFQKELNPQNGENLINAAILSGQDQFIIDQIKNYEMINANIKAFKIQPLIQLKRFNEAREILDEFKSLGLFGDNRVKPYDSALTYLSNQGIKKELLNQFVGQYRSFNNEQIIEMWVEHDRIIRNLSHQGLRAYSLGGPERVIGGALNSFSTTIDAIKDKKGKVVAIKTSYYNYNSTPVGLYFKLDKTIMAAQRAFESKNFDEARRLYELAYEDNPEHSYLKNLIDHIDYIHQKTPEELLEQYEKHAGNYGPRRFYIDNGGLYYKRRGEDSSLPRLEMLPIDESRYIDLTRQATIMSFETDPSGKPSSKSYSYIMDNEGNAKWEHLKTENVQNYFLKDD